MPACFACRPQCLEDDHLGRTGHHHHDRFDSVNNQLLFEFGPAGIHFSPDAIIRLDYQALGIDVPVLYYIDANGQYIEQTPACIDVTNRWLKVEVAHFSRYAVAWGE